MFAHIDAIHAAAGPCRDERRVARNAGALRLSTLVARSSNALVHSAHAHAFAVVTPFELKRSRTTATVAFFFSRPKGLPQTNGSTART